MVRTLFQPTSYLEPEEAHALINAASKVSHHAERDSLLLETLWQTGGRKTEVLTLTPERIGHNALALDNLKQPTLTVKEVYITATLCEKLKAFCKKHKIASGEYIFKPNRKDAKLPYLSPWYVWKLVEKCSREAMVFKLKKRGKAYKGPRYKEAWPHLFRHGAAMHILDTTGSTELVQRQLGHSFITTSQGYAVLKADKARRELSEIEW